MRKIFGKEIVKLAKCNNKVILIVGDIGYGIFDEFRQSFPDKFINMGICEQSMVGFASGLALEGMYPIVYTITPFLIERAFEQVKLDIDQQKTRVLLVGYDDYPKLGPTHRCLNIKKMTELFINIQSFFPQDNLELQKILQDNRLFEGPKFLRLTNSE